MPQSTSKSRKRKYQGNQWSQAKKIRDSNGNATNTEGEGSTSGSTSTSHASASARKLSHTSVNPKPKGKNINTKLDGYRILSFEILSNVLKEVTCQNCSKMCLRSKEDNKRRQGCASYLSFVCSSCDWKYCFYTSKKIKKGFEVNKRFVYGMRLIGQGRTSAKRFCGMNMPPPPK